MTDSQKQIGHTENDARADNELVSVEGEIAKLVGGHALAVLCECGDATCHKPLVMSVDAYEHVRSHPSQFAVLPGHVMLSAENVVEDFGDYVIVEKYGDAGDVADAADPRNHLKTCRVVIVDDIPEIRYLLKMLLALEASCTVVGEASNGREALEVVQRTHPEVLVMDLEMPVMDGWHALPLVKRLSPTTHVIVFSSTAIDARLEKRLVNLGSDRIVKKGGDPTVLMQAIRDVALSGRDRSFADGE